jgi:hypothetical protein
MEGESAEVIEEEESWDNLLLEEYDESEDEDDMDIDEY